MKLDIPENDLKLLKKVIYHLKSGSKTIKIMNKKFENLCKNPAMNVDYVYDRFVENYKKQSEILIDKKITIDLFKRREYDLVWLRYVKNFDGKQLSEATNISRMSLWKGLKRQTVKFIEKYKTKKKEFDIYGKF